MHELKAELIADKFASFWMFPKGFYHTCFRFETARLAAAASQKLKKEKTPLSPRQGNQRQAKTQRRLLNF